MPIVAGAPVWTVFALYRARIADRSWSAWLRSSVTKVTYLKPAEWYATLPTMYISACALLTDDLDRVLLVKPNYRDHWSVPGGIVEFGEAPHEGAEREILEELGLKISAQRLLVVDFVPPEGERPKGMLNFMFDGGVSDTSLIRMDDGELDGYQLFSWEEAATMLPPHNSARIPAARHARRHRQTIYLPAS